MATLFPSLTELAMFSSFPKQPLWEMAHAFIATRCYQNADKAAQSGKLRLCLLLVCLPSRGKGKVFGYNVFRGKKVRSLDTMYPFPLCWLLLCQLNKARVIREEGGFIEKMALHDWSAGKPLVLLLWKGPAHCGWYHPWGTSKKAG